jgi:hypothetical protein
MALSSSKAGEAWQWQRAGGFPFYTTTETQRSSQPIEVGTSGAIRQWPHGLDNGRPVRSRRRDRGRGKRDGREMLRRRTIVALKRMGSNGWKNRP